MLLSYLRERPAFLGSESPVLDVLGKGVCGREGVVLRARARERERERRREGRNLERHRHLLGATWSPRRLLVLVSDTVLVCFRYQY